MEANAEMIEGYSDGFDPNSPEPSANRSHSYRHSFIAGRMDRTGKVTHTAAQMREMADVAMTRDDAT